MKYVPLTGEATDDSKSRFLLLLKLGVVFVYFRAASLCRPAR